MNTFSKHEFWHYLVPQLILKAIENKYHHRKFLFFKKKPNEKWLKTNYSNWRNEPKKWSSRRRNRHQLFKWKHVKMCIDFIIRNISTHIVDTSMFFVTYTMGCINFTFKARRRCERFTFLWLKRSNCCYEMNKERKREFNVILANGLMLFYSSVISVCIDLFSIIYYYKQQLTKVSEWTCTFQLVFRNEGNGNGNKREWTL